MLFVQARNSVLRPAVTTATPHGFKFPIDFNESVETREVRAADRNGVNHEPLEAGTRAPSLLQDTPLETREFEKSPGPSKRELTSPVMWVRPPAASPMAMRESESLGKSLGDCSRQPESPRYLR